MDNTTRALAFLALGIFAGTGLNEGRHWQLRQQAAHQRAALEIVAMPEEVTVYLVQPECEASSEFDIEIGPAEMLPGSDEGDSYFVVKDVQPYIGPNSGLDIVTYIEYEADDDDGVVGTIRDAAESALESIGVRLRESQMLVPADAVSPGDVLEERLGSPYVPGDENRELIFASYVEGPDGYFDRDA